MGDKKNDFTENNPKRKTIYVCMDKMLSKCRGAVLNEDKMGMMKRVGDGGRRKVGHGKMCSIVVGGWRVGAIKSWMLGVEV